MKGYYFKRSAQVGPCPTRVVNTRGIYVPEEEVVLFEEHVSIGPKRYSTTSREEAPRFIAEVESAIFHHNLTSERVTYSEIKEVELDDKSLQGTIDTARQAKDLAKKVEKDITDLLEAC